jgi:hypothetical protein
MIALVGLLASAPVMAEETWSWDFASGCVTCGTTTKTFNGTGVGAPQVTARGWAANSTDSTAVLTSVSSGGDRLRLDISSSSGLELKTRVNGSWETSPNHAVDNSGRDELVMFDFGDKAVALNEITLGWWQTDADISLLAYTGIAGSTPDLTNIAYSGSSQGLTGAGWSLVGNYDVDSLNNPSVTAPNDVKASVNAGGLKSKYWIVAAYNGAFSSGGCIDGASNGICAAGNDYFKIKSLAGTYTPPSTGGGDNPVPVPSPLALAMLGLGTLILRGRLSA